MRSGSIMGYAGDWKKYLTLKLKNRMIKCKEFRDVNGIKHEWIPAIKLLT